MKASENSATLAAASERRMAETLPAPAASDRPAALAAPDAGGSPETAGVAVLGYN